MKISRHVFIAAIIISIVFIFFFIFYETLLSQTKIIIKDINIIVTTTCLESWDSKQSSNDFLKESQTPNLPGVFFAGMHIYIFDTGGDGLKIRSSAGLNGIPIYLGLEGEEFEIIEGPKIIDSKIWWKIASINNPRKIGWAVQDYLIKQ